MYVILIDVCKSATILNTLGMCEIFEYFFRKKKDTHCKEMSVRGIICIFKRSEFTSSVTKVFKRDCFLPFGSQKILRLGS